MALPILRVSKWLLGGLFILNSCWSQNLPDTRPPWRDTAWVLQQMSPDTLYSFYEIGNDTLFLAANLLRLWEKLAAGEKVRILHIGDSHIQGDVQGREIRKKLYALWGPGGRGYVFPYALAGTSSAYDYVSSGEGQWLYARSVQLEPALPLGITGIAIGTYDPSAIWRIRWAPEYTPAAPPSAQIGLLTRSLRPIQLHISYHDSTSPITLSLSPGYRLSWFSIQKPLMFLEGRFSWEGTDSLGYAELQGVFIEDTGRVSYYTMGISGARLKDLHALPLFKESLALLSPDLVVIDLGTNDLYGMMGGMVYKTALEAAIDTIRKALPESAILVTTPMSFYRKMKPVSELKAASQIARWVCLQKGVALWDAASLLGDIKGWRLSGLAHPDMVHLLPAGYAHKGQLFARAFLHGYWKYLVGGIVPAIEEGRGVTLPDSLLVARSIPATPVLSQWAGASVSPPPSPQNYAPPRPNYIYHKVRPGENLGSIAQRYRVSVQAIQRANGLSGTLIRAGQTLRIPVSLGGPTTQTPPKTPNSTNKPTPSAQRYHIVRPGESLWTIAQKYKTTPETLRRLNSLSPNQTIHPGQKLLIP